MGSPKEPLTKQPLGTSAWARFTSCWDLPAQGCSQSHPYPPLPSELLEVKAQTGPGRWEGSLGGWEVGKGLLTVFKVESVEIQAFHEVPQSLRLEGSHPGVAHLPGEEEGERRGEVIALLLAQQPFLVLRQKPDLVLAPQEAPHPRLQPSNFTRTPLR